MEALIIKADKESNKILLELAQKLGGTVINIEEEQFEDIALGVAMDKIKTGEIVDRDVIIKKLEGK